MAEAHPGPRDRFRRIAVEDPDWEFGDRGKIEGSAFQRARLRNSWKVLAARTLRRVVSFIRLLRGGGSGVLFKPRKKPLKQTCKQYCYG